MSLVHCSHWLLSLIVPHVLFILHLLHLCDCDVTTAVAAVFINIVVVAATGADVKKFRLHFLILPV